MFPFLFILFIISILLLYKIEIGFALAIVLCLLIPAAPGEYKLHFVKLAISTITCIAFFFNVLLIKNYYKTSNKGKLFGKPVLLFFTGLIFLAICAKGMSFPGQMKSITGIFTGYFIFCHVAWFIYDNSQKINQFANILFLASLLFAIYGLFCYFSESNPYISYIEEYLRTENDKWKMLVLNDEDRAGLTGRVQGTLNHPISWGGCCFLLFAYFHRTKMKTSLFVSLKPMLLILLILNVVLSGARSAILGLSVYIISVSIFNTKRKLSYYLIGIVSIIVIITAINTIPFLSQLKPLLNSTLFFWNESVATDNNIGGSSVSMRLMQFAGTFSMIGNSFITLLTGLGQGYTTYYLAEYGTHPILRGFESIIFMQLINGGIIGLFLWGYLFYTMVRNLKKMSWDNKIQRKRIISLKSYVLSYMIFIAFTGIMQTFLCFLVLYVLQVKELMIKPQQSAN